MERKIGEIFNYQDNWYQCIENTKDRMGGISNDLGYNILHT